MNAQSLKSQRVNIAYGLIKMKFPEVTRILAVKGKNEFSTYDANEYHPELSSNEMGSILRRDERTVNLGKRWLWCGCNHWARISIWRVAV